METLTREQKDIILDFYFQCGPEEDIDKARQLIATDLRAAELYSSLEDSLCQLDSEKYGPCPDNLTEITIAKLQLAASAETAKAETENAGLKTLLQKEHTKIQEPAPAPALTARRNFLSNIYDIAAVAAVIIVISLVGFPSFSYMRQKSQQNVCNANMFRVGLGLANYTNDNNSLPFLATAAGKPWWKVSRPGQQNHSNTRPLWLIVKNGYLDPKDFTCPGRADARNINFDFTDPQRFSDFPSRKYISYSFILISAKNAKRKVTASDIMLADRNPLFERIFEQSPNFDADEFEKLILNEQLQKMMSISHRGKGQNILFGDGAVFFKKSRVISGDDIYTITGQNEYSGCEAPSTKDDTFLIP